jgi:hypothetical protein
MTRKEEDKREIVLGLSKTLFWDVDPYSVDAEKHAEFIVDRVLQMGTWNEFKTILKYYGEKKIIKYATQLRYMDKIVLEFCVNYFNVPKDQFRCFSQRQLHPTHWNY